jgi:hypothetical protein
MSYEKIKLLSPTDFKRYCGIKPATFKRICDFIRAELKRTQKKPGRRPKLSIEDQLLLMLEYWREYRTQFHIAKSWQLSEPTVCRIIRKIENILKKSPDFALLGKKALSQSEHIIEVIVVDATETAIERPKKNNGDTIRAKRSGTR